MKFWIVAVAGALLSGFWQRTTVAKLGAQPVIAQSGVAAGGEFQGRWSTNYGPLELRVQGDQVAGSYRGGTLAGSVEDRRLNFRTAHGGHGRGYFIRFAGAEIGKPARVSNGE